MSALVRFSQMAVALKLTKPYKFSTIQTTLGEPIVKGGPPKRIQQAKTKVTTVEAMSIGTANISSTTATSATLTWSVSPSVSYVIITWGGQSTGTSGPISSTTLTYTASGLTSGGSYTFIITPYSSFNFAGTPITRFTQIQTVPMYYPVSARQVANPTLAVNGFNFTFISNNQYGEWFGNWFYDFDNTTVLSMDPYNGTNRAYSGTRKIGGVNGTHSGIIGSAPFVCTGFKFRLVQGNVNPPGQFRVLASLDNLSFTELDSATFTSVSQFDNGWATNEPGLTRTFANTNAYKYYYVVFTHALTNFFILVSEWRWLI